MTIDRLPFLVSLPHLVALMSLDFRASQNLVSSAGVKDVHLPPGIGRGLFTYGIYFLVLVGDRGGSEGPSCIGYFSSHLNSK